MLIKIVILNYIKHKKIKMDYNNGDEAQCPFLSGDQKKNSRSWYYQP